MHHMGGPPLGAMLTKQQIWSAGDSKTAQQDKFAPIPVDGGVVQ